MSTSNRPVHEIVLGRIRASIWANRSQGRGPWFNVVITRAYRDGETWKTTTSFGRDDLPVVVKVAEMAYAWLWQRQGDQHDQS